CRTWSGSIQPRALVWVVVRSLLLTLMWLIYYAALSILSLPVAALAFYTTPLFIAVFSPFLIREPVSSWQWLGLALGFAGVLLILRPGTEAFSPAMILLLVAAVAGALAMILPRSKCRNVHPLVLAMGLNCSLLIMGAVAIVVFALLPLQSSTVA